MFKYLRVQILYPCRARCVWCSTHRKNALFHRLWREGISDRIHEAYADIIARYQPTQVFLSGGEPLLYPGIATFLNRIRHDTAQVNVFTSFQFGRADRDRIPFAELPLEKIVFHHTPIYFEPERWGEMTGTFPFEVYVDNLRFFRALPARKRFKFIINRPSCAEEIRLFQERVEPDATCEFGLKAVNDQGDGLCVGLMSRSSDLVVERVRGLTATAQSMNWKLGKLMEGSLEVMAPILERGDVTRCGYRDEPLELRFSLASATAEKQILWYRYCPSFPPRSGHRFHVGRDDPGKFAENFRKGTFHRHCGDCRFLHYWRAAQGRAAAG